MTLPSVLVTDTNIWIDLENGKVLADVFRLPYQFITTDFAVEELSNPRWKTLQNLGLQTHDLEPENVRELGRLREIYRRLSTIDLAAFLLARALDAKLLTGDRRLNELAKANGVQVHGVLWILDEMVNHHVLAEIKAANALREMLNKDARLPNNECQTRFVSWSFDQRGK